MAPDQRATGIRVLRPILALLAVTLVWQALWWANALPRDFFPSAAAIAAALWSGLSDGQLLSPLASTVVTWISGFVLTLVAGVALGILMGLSPTASALLSRLVKLVRPVPSLVFIPAVILVAGIGLEAKLILVFFGAVWVLVLNVAYSVVTVPQEYFDVARSLHLSRTATISQVVLPAALPGTMTGVRVVGGITLAITVGAELLVGTSGLGQYILTNENSHNVSDVYAGILLGGLLGVVINHGLVLIEARFAHWSPGNRRQVRAT